ncbi:MAG: hypothetical protein EXR54_02270 [Dehalococcoidia bacterium]|nr:hypothetical protein [Dehalococcoidia bacterium]MSQ16383.1 hypothetical protein [Dehalococcoidia bacterium]
MTSQKETHLTSVRRIRDELSQTLEGMDYCLDWKPDPATWSAREVIYHLLDTPPGGVHRVLMGILSGQLTEYDLWADKSNMTPQRAAYSLEQVRADLMRFFQGLEAAVGMAEEGDFAGRSVLVHLKTRGRDETRTPQVLLERGFTRHWGEHLAQLRALREALGV